MGYLPGKPVLIDERQRNRCVVVRPSSPGPFQPSFPHGKFGGCRTGRDRRQGLRFTAPKEPVVSLPAAAINCADRVSLGWSATTCFNWRSAASL